MPVRYGSLPFNEAITFFRNKQNIPTERWNDIWRHGHNSAFMVAGAMADDLVNDFRRAIDRAIAEGKSYTWFQQEFKAIRAKHGWAHSGSSAWRSKVIFDTNMRQSYNAGRYEQLQHFDVWEYQHGDSQHPRELHLSWDGLRLAKDDKFWLTHFPQNGWGCKCKVRGRTKAWMERHGYQLDESPVIDLVEWADKVTGEVHWVAKGIDPGFDYAPQKATLLANQQQLARQKAKPYVAPKRVVPTAFSTVERANVHGLNKVMDALKQTHASEQIALIEQFLNKHQTKTLLLKQSEMNASNKAARALSADILSYLDDSAKRFGIYNYTYQIKRGESMPNGFTSPMFNHIVIKLDSKANFNQVDIVAMQNAIELAIQLSKSELPYTLSSIVRRYSDKGYNGGAMMTWLHELGHQIHFKAGQPIPPIERANSLTHYGSSLDVEWFAEHFLAWALNRKALAKWNNEVAEYFDNLIKSTLHD
ncbi:hypothetical protein tloyanaT_26170 [Thalassotalea loyana]|uniref:Phage head morphogenesis domain-containing protein n=1 Tax=Thalassotalea loyana TaxID=280483 RepID=A0ABQ6HFK6_9GAMM|nr:phage minor head protein [Thalassotalea loyana]GLX86364.1 hypothetical protein tloyanaT_26170 [Thalassotalea loyana]